MKVRFLGMIASIALVASACGGGNDRRGGSELLDIGEVIARGANGVALRLGESVTTEGVVIVDAPVFANNKLKSFIQEGTDGVMVFHATSAGVPSFGEGDRLRISGRVLQADPTSDANRAEGTIMVDVTDGVIEVLSTGNPLPSPTTVTCAQLADEGDGFVGTLVRIEGVRRVAGAWPSAGSRSAEVTITDDDSHTVILRMQRNTIDAALADRFAAIGDTPFDLMGIVVQDDTNNDGDLLDGFELWIRGVKDIGAPALGAE